MTRRTTLYHDGIRHLVAARARSYVWVCGNTERTPWSEHPEVYRVSTPIDDDEALAVTCLACMAAPPPRSVLEILEEAHARGIIMDPKLVGSL